MVRHRSRAARVVPTNGLDLLSPLPRPAGRPACRRAMKHARARWCQLLLRQLRPRRRWCAGRSTQPVPQSRPARTCTTPSARGVNRRPATRASRAVRMMSACAVSLEECGQWPPLLERKQQGARARCRVRPRTTLSCRAGGGALRSGCPLLCHWLPPAMPRGSCGGHPCSRRCVRRGRFVSRPLWGPPLHQGWRSSRARPRALTLLRGVAPPDRTASSPPRPRLTRLKRRRPGMRCSAKRRRRPRSPAPRRQRWHRGP